MVTGDHVNNTMNGIAAEERGVIITLVDIHSDEIISKISEEAKDRCTRVSST